MTDEEFDLLDELYFVISYNDLKHQSGLTDDRLKALLTGLFEKEWLRIFDSPDNARDVETVKDLGDWEVLYFLASKKGLLAHNS